MSRFVFWWNVVLVVVLGLAGSNSARAGDAAPLEKTLAPYFVVEGGDPNVAGFPLESTRVNVAVTGVIAEVTVTQAYVNRGRRPINAEYVFPASTRAAVHGLTMKIRDQLISAVIKEREQAKATFEAAKKEGKSATLLEQQRPNVFTMNVANVMPGDRIEVTLRYSEYLVPTSGTYELVFPTVVGPRYSNRAEASAPNDSRFVASPYSPEGSPATSSFELTGTLATAIPVKSIESPSHAVTTALDNPSLVRFELAATERGGNNRDFILRYRLSGDAIQGGLQLFDDGKEKFFLLAVEPPARVEPEAIPPREFVFVLDVSGSMMGFPLDTAKKLLRDLVGGLRSVDRFNVLLFSGASELLAERSLPATRENLALAARFIDGQRGGGGTELLPALERAFGLSTDAGLSRSFVVVTDGYIEQDKDAIDLVRRRLSDANVFSFGIGSSVNRFLVEGLAKAGLGEPFVVTDPGKAAETAQRFRDYVRSPVLTDVKVAYEGFDAFDVEPRAVPDVLAERPVVVQGKWRGTPSGAVTVSGVSGRGAFSQRFDVSRTPPRAEHRALSYLWARNRIASLSDFGFGEPSEATRAQITSLGLSYNLLTRYTSFVAVAQTVRNPGAPASDVKQPLPLPAGVSNSAVGGGIEGADEPELWLLALLALVAVVTLRFRSKRREAASA
jgi:Ca-activated chloride channel family protein